MNNKMRVYLRAFQAAAFSMVMFLSQLGVAEAKINTDGEKIPEFKMWLGAGLPEMQAYEEAALRLMLEKSRKKYGDYNFVAEASANTIKRQERIFRSSVAIAINVSPVNDLYNNSSISGYATMPHPIAKGMLGYRQLLVNKSRIEEFRRIRTLEDLQKYSIGQVSGWADIDVLQRNGIDVRVVQKYDLLFPMLKNNRFDSLSVGCTETASLLNFLDKHHPGQFELVPDLVLFYPLSLYVFVNKNQPEAIDRLTYGYTEAVKSGEIDSLFENYHGATFKKLKKPGLKIIQLKNPENPSDQAFPELLLQ